MNYIDKLEEMEACKGAIAWLRGYKSKEAMKKGERPIREPYPTLKEAWEDCNRADWMLWEDLHPNPSLEIRQALAACALEIAETVEHPSPEAQHCNQVNRRYQAGEATWKELSDAALVAARAAAGAAAAAMSAAWAASDAASAAGAAAWTARAARYAWTARYARYASAAWSAWAASDAAIEAGADPKQLADLVRKHIPCPRLGDSDG